MSKAAESVDSTRETITATMAETTTGASVTSEYVPITSSKA